MFELKTSVPNRDRRLPDFPRSRNFQEPKQRRTMVAALTLLLIALGFVLYRDRDFWFPEEQAEDQPATPAVETPSQTAKARSAARKKSRSTKSPSKTDAATDPSTPPMTATRTVLPPLEVEVVAGNVHRILHPSTNTVEVNLQPSSPLQQQVPDIPATGTAAENADGVTNAAEHVQMSVDTAEVVTQPAKPDYPLLARPMKVQGSVILQALIGRDGRIQDLRVVSGPPILAGAAEQAVKQWHFKPHFQNNSPVETQAKITVNFTISTN